MANNYRVRRTDNNLVLARVQSAKRAWEVKKRIARQSGLALAVDYFNGEEWIASEADFPGKGS